MSGDDDMDGNTECITDDAVEEAAEAADENDDDDSSGFCAWRTLRALLEASFF
jgi:hypothetical protein